MITRSLCEIKVDARAPAAPDRIALNPAGGEWKFYLFDTLLRNMNGLSGRANIPILECARFWWLRRSKPRDLQLSAVHFLVTRKRVWWLVKAVYGKNPNTASNFVVVFCCYIVSKSKLCSFSRSWSWTVFGNVLNLRSHLPFYGKRRPFLEQATYKLTQISQMLLSYHKQS